MAPLIFKSRMIEYNANTEQFVAHELQHHTQLPQILALRRIIEELQVSEKKATIVFVDFSKAFDSVNRKVAVHILKNYGIPVEIMSYSSNV